MASEYTTNYNLDLYTDTDKPNLRDQYNGAMRKVDAQLHEFSNNMVIITDSANQAREKAAAAQAAAEANTKSISTLNTTVTEMDSAYKAADEKLSSDITEIANDYKAADTSMNDSLMEMINSHFPIKSGDIQAGAITRDKLDAQALESIIKGITIRRFDSEDGNADNTGLIVPNNNCKLSGFYLPELTMLVITRFELPAGQPCGSYFSETTQFRLPSYVPHTTAAIVKLGAIAIKYSASSDFVNWTGVGINKNGYFGVSTEYNEAGISLQLAGNAVVFLRAYGAA